MIGLQFRDQVTRFSQSVADEFEQLVAGARGFLGVEHNDDGTHADITATSVTTETLEVTESANIAFITVEDGEVSGQFNGYVNASPLRLNPAGAYTINATDSSLLGSGTTPRNAEFASLWSLSASANRSILGIFAPFVDADELTALTGHVLVLMNTSAFFLTFATTVGHAERQLLGCDPSIKIGPGGSIVFVYDGDATGWRVVSHTRDYNADPCGHVSMQAMTSIKPGWLELGQAVSRATYAALFAEIGTTFGIGDGSTTFDLPPKGVFPIFTGGTPALALGATGGAWNHTHAVGSLAAASESSHTHSVSGSTDSGGAHTHDVEGDTGAGTGHSHTIAQTEGTNMETTGGGSYVEYPVGTAGETGAESSHTHPAGSLAAASDGAHTHGLSGATVGAGSGHTHTLSGATASANPPYAAFVAVIRT